jgi:hypothetical protein
MLAGGQHSTHKLPGSTSGAASGTAHTAGLLLHRAGEVEGRRGRRGNGRGRSGRGRRGKGEQGGGIRVDRRVASMEFPKSIKNLLGDQGRGSFYRYLLLLRMCGCGCSTHLCLGGAKGTLCREVSTPCSGG